MSSGKKVRCFKRLGEVEAIQFVEEDSGYSNWKEVVDSARSSCVLGELFKADMRVLINLEHGDWVVPYPGGGFRTLKNNEFLKEYLVVDEIHDD